MPDLTIPADLTFDHVPEGFTAFEHHRVLGTTFDDAVRRITSWEMHERAGLRVTAAGPPEVGRDVVSRTRAFGVPVTAPCRVIDLEDTPSRYRMVYATLPGHPLCGIEEFRVDQQTGRVVASIRAVSRPAWAVTRLAPAVVRAEQQRIAHRYLAALGVE